MILVTNDDGITSPGLLKLVEAVTEAGYDAGVVAPASQMSGSGMSTTLTGNIRVMKTELKGCPAFSVSGTPSDCVLIGIAHLFPDLEIEAVFSGINQGINAGLGVIYNSGTISAAMVAAMNGYPSIAFSQSEEMENAGSGSRDDMLKKMIGQIAKSYLEHREPVAADVLNVNFPDSLGYDTGMVVTPFSDRVLHERRVERVSESEGMEFFRISIVPSGTGGRRRSDDINAIFNDGNIAVTPIFLTERRGFPQTIDSD